MTDIADLEEGDELTHEFFLLNSASIRETTSGDPYVAGELRDKTGRLDLRMWQTDTHPEPGVVVAVDGYVDTYDGALQIVADSVVDADDKPTRDYVESAHRPPADLLDEIVHRVETHCQGDVYDLLLWVLRGDAERTEGLLAAPAARRNHHARHGGLLEHIWSMQRLAVSIWEHYWSMSGEAAAFDLPLLMGGTILHDIGKLEEHPDPAATETTERGELRGHIQAGVDLLRDAAKATGVDRDSELYWHLEHLILSHHGRKEWGSPVEPKTPEAVLLHQIDMLDSSAEPVRRAVLDSLGEGRVETPRGEELLVPGGGS